MLLSVNAIYVAELYDLDERDRYVDLPSHAVTSLRLAAPLGSRLSGYFAVSAVASRTFAAFGVALVALNRWPGRLSAPVRAFAAAQSSVWPQRADCEGRICEVGAPPPGAPKVLLLGDSHAAALAPALRGAELPHVAR